MAASASEAKALKQLLRQHGSLKLKEACKLLRKHLGLKNEDREEIKYRIKQHVNSASYLELQDKVITLKVRRVEASTKAGAVIPSSTAAAPEQYAGGTDAASYQSQSAGKSSNTKKNHSKSDRVASENRPQQADAHHKRKKQRTDPIPQPPQTQQHPALPAATQEQSEPKKKRKLASTHKSAERQDDAGRPPAQPDQQQPAEPASSKGRQKKQQQPVEAAVAAAASDQDILGPKSKRKRMLDTSWKEDFYRSNAKHGLFSDTEKEALKVAVKEYAGAHGLDSDSYDWLFQLGKKGRRGAITTIAMCLPHRSRASVYYCLVRLFHPGNYQGRWSREEDALLLQLVQQHGQRWVEVGGALGRLGDACRDRHRLIKDRDRHNSGSWSSVEEAKLVELVSEVLEARGGQAALPVGPAGSMRDSGKSTIDNINWDWVAEQMGTRNANSCMKKWYGELSPSMVARGDWGPGDDKRLLRHLLASGAQYQWEVDWGAAVAGRSAAQCLRRWRLMLKCVRHQRQMELPELVGCLVDQYCPRLRLEQQQQQQQQVDR